MTTKEKTTATEAKTANDARAKPVSLPPPGEAFQPEPRGLKKAWKKKKPMTTREKVKANGLLASAEAGGPGSLRSKGKLVTKREKSTFDMVMDQTSSSHKHAGKVQKVTERPTYRTKRLREDAARLRKETGTNTNENSEAAEAKEPFKLMKLPQELRAEIWKLVVVDTKFFIWPGLPSGREQPDLAMVSRQVRMEVLPIFYRLNTFAIELESPRSVIKQSTGIHSLVKWSKALDQGGCFSNIRAWAFQYDPTGEQSVGASADPKGSAFVFVKFTACTNETSLQKGWNVSVEVHREARCVIPGTAEYGQCVLKRTPGWLNQRVIDIADAASGRTLRNKEIVQLAYSIRDRAHSLSEHNCFRAGDAEWNAAVDTTELEP